MDYRPTVAECRHLFNLVNLISFDGIMICPNIRIKSKMPKGIWAHADIELGTPGNIELNKVFPSYAHFVKALIHEIGHIWVGKIVGNRKENHGKNFKRYLQIIKKTLNGLDVDIIPWTTLKTDTRKGTFKTSCCRK